MARYQVLLAYDGSEFSGFQRQSGTRTVQGVVEAALKALGWRGKSLLAAGRTDTGVHATGQAIAFDLNWSHSTDDLLRALNANLPADLAIRQVRLTSLDFHPRYAALGRRYQYHIFCDGVRQPLKERYTWRVWPEVDLSAVVEAGKYLIGTYDFSAFGNPPRKGGSTTRTVLRAGWLQNEADLIFDITGNAFLYQMVRRIVALLVSVGQGRAKPIIVKQYLEGAELKPLQLLAPPQGLFLVEVIYPHKAESWL